MESKYINIMSVFNKTEKKLSLFWQNVLFPYMNPTSYFKPLIHGQINLIKFIESNKFKIWRIFVWSNFEKIGHVLFHQINFMKKSQSK